ncbi:hypothetical protein [Fibrella aquatilis]|uniref:Uncharacterized protein n=1 Tax=Fibrella aquatilis TaxID=2817059 RepID=A0A939G7Q8_9BACT|nr:hypothetical protein [Fibrella aquatilis]MBO0931920.1 hypothetical protein [Fibrella aquatilis]
MRISFFLLRVAVIHLLTGLVMAFGQGSTSVLARYDQQLASYRASLNQLRRVHSVSRPMPDRPFFLFGMGDRRKFVYRNGLLTDALTGDTLRRWAVRRAVIVPSEYTVAIETNQQQLVLITETEQGVFLREGNQSTALSNSPFPLRLPHFNQHRYGPVLRVLHHEILINVNQGLPVPNFFVYKKPWLRDAALMGMVMQQTGNLRLIKDWIMALRDPFDRNNHGVAEADNPGEVLFLISLVSNKNHPLVGPTLDSARQFVKQTATGPCIEGKTDYALHPVFQTKWMKYGLNALGLPDPYQIPAVYDAYSSLFWWGYKNQHVAGKRFDAANRRDYPYLAWAEDHFYSRPGAPEVNGIMTDQDYPLSWEANASDAYYPGLQLLDSDLIRQKLSPPHTWHAAEMFLLLAEQK